MHGFPQDVMWHYDLTVVPVATQPSTTTNIIENNKTTNNNNTKYGNQKVAMMKQQQQQPDQDSSNSNHQQESPISFPVALGLCGGVGLLVALWWYTR
jgi:hypothetical protein